jgi:hypothetical protein
VRPLSIVVSATSVAMLLLGARVLAGRRSPAVERAPEELPPPPAEPPRPATFRAQPARQRQAVVSHELAHLRGRVIVSGGAKVNLRGLEVEADDGTHTFDAQVDRDGAFELHLPPRTYTLLATDERLVGIVEGVRAEAGAAREVTITLGAGATIAGRLELPAGKKDVDIKVLRAGTSVPAGEAGVEGDRFEITGLVAGRRYDLEFQGAGLRTARLAAMAAPTAELLVRLAARGRLRGAIGFEPGTACPFDSLTIITSDHRENSGPDGDEPEGVHVDRNCQFEVEVPDTGELELRGDASGWHLEARVPLSGDADPAPVCLNPPCRDLPRIEAATLEVSMTGAGDEGGVDASIQSATDHRHNRGCMTSHGGACDFADLEAGDTWEVRISRAGCREVTQTVRLHGGVNSVSATCQAMRLVQGVARSDDESPRRNLAVRCAGGGTTFVNGRRRTFELYCPSDTTELTYEPLDGSHRAATVPLAPGAQPAFVELTL